MSEGTEVGKIHLGVVIDPELAEGDPKAQLAKISKILEKGLANLKGSFKLKGLDEAFEECFKNMNTAMNEQMEIMKASMRDFIASIKEMLKNAKFNFGSPSINRTDVDTRSSQDTSTPNSTRGPPGLKIKAPSIKFDDLYDTEMFQQKYEELENLMDFYDNKIALKQAKRKALLDAYKPDMSADAENALNQRIMDLDFQISKLQDMASRTNITLSAMDRQMASAAEGTGDLSNQSGGLKGKLGALSAALKDVGKKAMAAGLKKLGNGFKSAGKHALTFTARLLGISSASKKASSGMNGAGAGLGRLIKSFVIFSLIFPLVSQGVRALGQSISSALMTNETFVHSLDQIKSNLMAAFMPIYSAILPALNALMSALANVTAHIAAFVSSLFGTTYIASINAAKGMVAAKDAMGAYGSAAKKAAKDANASVMAFDHLNKLNGKNDSDDGSGSKAPNIIPTDIDTSSASKFAEKIKKMFADQDYEGIGKMIGDGINKGVAKITQFIDWSNVGSKITAAVDGFSRIFNSAVATIDWRAAGAMVGTGVNTIANTVKMFFEKINWQLLGSSLASGLNGIVHTVDWDNLGQTLGSYFMARINGLYGFVSTADWAGIGKALADGVMGLANYIDFEKLGTTLGTGVQGTVSAMHNFVTNIDWRELGSKIASTLNNFFSSVDWGEMGLTFSDAVDGILNTLRKALADFDFVQIGMDIADFLCNVDWLSLLLDVGVVIGRAFLGIGQTILSFILELAGNIVSGFFNGILEFFGDPIGWIRKHIVDPFVNAIKDLFGIHSPSTVLADIGVNLIQGLINGIGDLIPSLLSNIGNWLGELPGKFLGFASNAISSFCEGIRSIDVLGVVKSIVGGATDWLGGLWKSATTWGSDMISGFVDGIKGAASWIGDAVGGVADTISSWLHFSRPDIGPLREYEKWMPDMLSGMSRSLQQKMPVLLNSVKGLAAQVSASLNDIQPSVAFTGQTTTADQYNNNYISSDDMILLLLKEIVGLLKDTGKGGGTTSTQEIVVKIGDTEMARVVIAAIKKYEKETGKQVLVS